MDFIDIKKVREEKKKWSRVMETIVGYNKMGYNEMGEIKTIEDLCSSIYDYEFGIVREILKYCWGHIEYIPAMLSFNKYGWEKKNLSRYNKILKFHSNSFDYLVCKDYKSLYKKMYEEKTSDYWKTSGYDLEKGNYFIGKNYRRDTDDCWNKSLYKVVGGGKTNVIAELMDYGRDGKYGGEYKMYDEWISYKIEEHHHQRDEEWRYREDDDRDIIFGCKSVINNNVSGLRRIKKTRKFKREGEYIRVSGIHNKYPFVLRMEDYN